MAENEYPGDSAVFADPRSGEYYRIYTIKNEGIFLLSVDPRSGSALSDEFGINIARRPSFDSMISHGHIFYNNDNGFYYLFAVYGNLSTGNIRVGRSHNVRGPYLDHDGVEMTDINDFSGTRGFLVAAPHMFDDIPVVLGYSKPVIINRQGHLLMSCTLNLRGEEKPVSGFEDIIWYNDRPLSIPYGLTISETYGNRHFTCGELYGRYEFIKYGRSLFQPMADYVTLNILPPHGHDKISAADYRPVKLSDISNGRIELGGSHRGGWSYNEAGRIIINYGLNTEICNIIPVKNIFSGSETILLIGTDTHGTVTIAKKYRDIEEI